MQFVLASESPRRVALLRQVGYDFEARKSGFPEVKLDDPRATVEANARGKALAVAGDELSADGLVKFLGEWLERQGEGRPGPGSPA